MWKYLKTAAADNVLLNTAELKQLWSKIPLEHFAAICSYLNIFGLLLADVLINALLTPFTSNANVYQMC